MCRVVPPRLPHTQPQPCMACPPHLPLTISFCLIFLSRWRLLYCPPFAHPPSLLPLHRHPLPSPPSLSAPQLTRSNELHIEGGRHLLTEQLVDTFIPNDTHMQAGQGRIQVQWGAERGGSAACFGDQCPRRKNAAAAHCRQAAEDGQKGSRGALALVLPGSRHLARFPPPLTSPYPRVLHTSQLLPLPCPNFPLRGTPHTLFPEAQVITGPNFSGKSCYAKQLRAGWALLGESTCNILQQPRHGTKSAPLSLPTSQCPPPLLHPSISS